MSSNETSVAAYHFAGFGLFRNRQKNVIRNVPECLTRMFDDAVAAPHHALLLSALGTLGQTLYCLQINQLQSSWP